MLTLSEFVFTDGEGATSAREQPAGPMIRKLMLCLTRGLLGWLGLNLYRRIGFGDGATNDCRHKSSFMVISGQPCPVQVTKSGVLTTYRACLISSLLSNSPSTLFSSRASQQLTTTTRPLQQTP
jgi:hypothetical protein